VLVMATTLPKVEDSFGPQCLAFCDVCWKPRRGCCGCSPCCNSLDEMTLYVGLLGQEIIVHEPDELREHMAALGALLSRAAQRPG